MLKTIIFDLSEVLIRGLLGIEKPLSKRLHIPENSVLLAFGSNTLDELFCGKISEDQFLLQIVEKQRWDISIDELRQFIRRNCHYRIPSVSNILQRLATKYELVLFSDHERECVDYIKSVHPFLKIFKAQFYSFELKQTKSAPATFWTVLEAIGRNPQECLFIDDSRINVGVANSVGIPSILFINARELYRRLVEFGILDDGGE